MAFIERFSQIVKGDMLFVGNTLGLSKEENQNKAGNVGSIGAFISLEQNEQVLTFPKGTTLDYLKNGSSAQLNLPNDSEVLYAELVWSGLYRSKTQDISSALKKTITFETPKGSFEVGAEYKTKQDVVVAVGGINIGAYVRTANVTEMVKKGLGGTYSVKKIPSLVLAEDAETIKTNFAGWTLIVAFKNDRLTAKQLQLKVGIQAVFEQIPPQIVELKGFEIPKTNKKQGRLLISSGEGDAHILGDTVEFGENESALTKLSGKYNPENNFFASQINDKSGEIDLTSTFGDRNQNAITGENMIAGRQGWDIASISLNECLTANPTTSMVRFSSTGDLYFPNAVGLVVDSSSANLRVTKSADKDVAVWGDIITYTILIENIGDIEAKDVAIFDPTPKYLEFSQGSLEVDGVKMRNEKFPLALSNLASKQAHIVTFKMRVKNKATKILKNTANVSYSYVLSNGEKVKETSNSNVVCLRPEEEASKLEIIKAVDKAFAQNGEILTYTNNVKNVGEVELENVFFFDNLPNNLEFIDGSVSIDGVSFPSYEPYSGFNLGNLTANNSVNVVFKVKIKEG